MNRNAHELNAHELKCSITEMLYNRNAHELKCSIAKMLMN